MKTSLKYLILITFSLFFIGCQEGIDHDKIANEEYKKTHDLLEKDYKEKVKEKYKVLKNTPSVFTQNKEIKELDPENKIVLQFGGFSKFYRDTFKVVPFNTISLAGEFYGYDSIPKFPLEHQENIKNLRKWVEGDSLIFDDSTPTGNRIAIDEFKVFCDYFLDVKYVVVTERIKLELPHYVKLNKVTEYGNDFEFHPAFEIGRVMVLQVEGAKGLAYAEYQSKMPDKLEVSSAGNIDRYLLNTFFTSTRDTKMEALTQYFDIEGEIPTQKLALGEKLNLQIDQ